MNIIGGWIVMPTNLKLFVRSSVMFISCSFIYKQVNLYHFVKAKTLQDAMDKCWLLRPHISLSSGTRLRYTKIQRGIAVQSPLVQFRRSHINPAHGVVGCCLKHGRVWRKLLPSLALSSNPVLIVSSNAEQDPKVVVNLWGSFNITVKKIWYF